MRFIIFFIASIFSAAVYSETLNETRTIKRIFAEGTASGGFYTNEGLPQCLYHIMYLKLDTDTGKAQFSMLLAAKASGQKIVRIDYTVNPSNGKCNLTGFHVE